MLFISVLVLSLFILDFTKCILFHSFIISLMVVDFHLEIIALFPCSTIICSGLNLGEKNKIYVYTYSRTIESFLLLSRS